MLMFWLFCVLNSTWDRHPVTHNPMEGPDSHFENHCSSIAYSIQDEENTRQMRKSQCVGGVRQLM